LSGRISPSQGLVPMAKNTPAFQFYPSDFMGGVAFLNEEETGAYIKLLCCLWIQGNCVPDNLDKLSRASSIPLPVLERVWPSIQDKFVIQSGNVTHARFARMMEISEIRREVGAKAKQTPKQNGSKSKSKSGAICLKNEERRMKNEDGSQQPEDWVLPSGWDSPSVRKALDDWAAMRKREKMPVKSKKSTSKIFKRFNSPEHLIAACEICEANAWQGLNPEYGVSKFPKTQTETVYEKLTPRVRTTA